MMIGKTAVGFLSGVIAVLLCINVTSRVNSDHPDPKVARLVEQVEQLKPDIARLAEQVGQVKKDVSALRGLDGGLHEEEGAFDYLSSVREDCGELCDTARSGKPGIHFDQISAQVNCDKIIRNPHWDRPHPKGPAPKEIPRHLLKEFTTSGKVPVTKWHIDQQYLGGQAAENKWTAAMVNEQIALAKEGKLKGTYSIKQTGALLVALRKAPSIIGGRVLVIGSERPWVEACALAVGAKSVVTLEYGEIHSEHPQIQTITPPQFRAKYVDKTLGIFDGVISFSSVEHAGLGRYGDALNPWADIITIAQAWCVTREKGAMVIGVMGGHGADELVFNAHRIYGKIRYPYLTTNWKNTHRVEAEQPAFVFVRES